MPPVGAVSRADDVSNGSIRSGSPSACTTEAVGRGHAADTASTSLSTSGQSQHSAGDSGYAGPSPAPATGLIDQPQTHARPNADDGNRHSPFRSSNANAIASNSSAGAEPVRSLSSPIALEGTEISSCDSDESAQEDDVPAAVTGGDDHRASPAVAPPSGNAVGSGCLPQRRRSLSISSITPVNWRKSSAEEREREVKWRPSYELDGMPLPNIEHSFYDERHPPEPENEISYAFHDCWRSREHFKMFLTKNYRLHTIIAILIVIDIIIVVGQLIIDLEILLKSECHHNHDCPVVYQNDTGNNTSCYYDENATKCIYIDGERLCVDEHTKGDKDPASILHYLSIAVLALFVLETLVRVLALGKEFFVRKLEVVDGAVVTIAFILDVSIGHDAAVALIMFVRLWRVARILNGFAIAIEAREAYRRERLSKKIKIAKNEEKRKKRTINLLKAELREWKAVAAIVYYPPTTRVYSPTEGMFTENSSRPSMLRSHAPHQPANASTPLEDIIFQ